MNTKPKTPDTRNIPLDSQEALVLKIKNIQGMLASDKFPLDYKQALWSSLRVAVKQLTTLRGGPDVK